MGIWEFHFWTLVFTLYFNFVIRIVKINIKIRTYFKSLVSKAQEHGGRKEPQDNDKPLWKTLSSICHIE